MGVVLSRRAIFLPTDQPGIVPSFHISLIIPISDHLGPGLEPWIDELLHLLRWLQALEK